MRASHLPNSGEWSRTCLTSGDLRIATCVRIARQHTMAVATLFFWLRTGFRHARTAHRMRRTILSAVRGGSHRDQEGREQPATPGRPATPGPESQMFSFSLIGLEASLYVGVMVALAERGAEYLPIVHYRLLPSRL